MADLSPLQHTGIGALAGFLEVCIMQPTVGIKNALQQNRPVPWSPMVLYRGVAVCAGHWRAWLSCSPALPVCSWAFR